MKRKRNHEQSMVLHTRPVPVPVPVPVLSLGDWAHVGHGNYGQVTQVTVFKEEVEKKKSRKAWRLLATKWIPVTQPPGMTPFMDDVEKEILGVQEEDDLLDIPEEEEEKIVPTDFDEALHEAIILGILSALRRKAPAFLHLYKTLVLMTSSSSSEKEESMATIPPPLQEIVGMVATPPQYHLGLLTDLGDAGTLHSLFLQQGRTVPVPQAASIFFDLLWSFFVAHTQGALKWHGDIQSRNLAFKTRHPHAPRHRFQLLGLKQQEILGQWQHPLGIEPSLQVKLIDFGFASFYHLRPGSCDDGAWTGTHLQDVSYHAPPELYFGRSDLRNDKSDVWQLGIILFSLLAPVPQRLARIKQQWNAWRNKEPGSRSLTHDDLVLYHALHASVLDSINVPVEWVTALAKSMNVNPPPDDALNKEMEEEDDENFMVEQLMMRPQADLQARFVRLLFQHPDLPRDLDLNNELQRDEKNAHKYARFLSIGLLQEALGNGWCPSLEVAQRAGYAKSSFYQCLQHPIVQRFWKRYVLPMHLRLMPIMQTMLKVYSRSPVLKAMCSDSC